MQIHNINVLNAQIATAVEQQTNVSEKVSGNINQIIQASE
tara:strand:- start:58962 stop:59081 length:120 start_codon:yes stop_codon:yes gene_type:complete